MGSDEVEMTIQAMQEVMGKINRNTVNNIRNRAYNLIQENRAKVEASENTESVETPLFDETPETDE